MLQKCVFLHDILSNMKKLFYLLVVVLVSSSCNEYQKVYKSEDVALKNKTAEALYNQGKYRKALKLYEQIVPKYRGSAQAERVMYFYADVYYQLRDHYLAGYQFDRFVKAYPKSDKLEEATFKAAKSSYYLSPRYSLDQTDSKTATSKLQSFLNKFPDSEHAIEANKIIAELRIKQERKFYEIAKQYHHTESYKVAIAAFDNFVIDYPGSRFKERALYYKFDAAYELAINSLPNLVAERLHVAKGYYNNYMKYYQNNGAFLKPANAAIQDITKRLEKNEKLTLEDNGFKEN